MIIKRANLHWYVINKDFNSETVKQYDVLGGTEEKIAKMIKKRKIKTREQFKENLKISLMSRYWSRCEYEILVGDIFLNDDNLEQWLKNASKVDIWFQIEPNLDIMVDYIIDKMQIKFEE